MAKSVEAASQVKGKVSLEYVVPAKEYYGLEMAAGQTLRIIEIEGQQVMDNVFLNARNPHEQLSVVWSKSINATWKLTKGHMLYSVHCNPMVEITEDTVGMNYGGGSYCTQWSNHFRYGDPYPRNCHDNLTHALAPFGVDRAQVTESSEFCNFMNVGYDPDGSCEIRAPISEPGDFIGFKAHMDLLVGMSCCPQEKNPCNNFRAKPLKFVLFE